MTDGFTNIQLIYNTVVWASSVFFAWLNLDVNMFLAFSILLIIDYVTGLGKAFYLKQSITSNRMKYGILSKISLVTIPLVLTIAAKGLDKDVMILIDSSMGILIISEVYSIFGNVYSMNRGEELPEFDAVAAIARRIRVTLVDWEEKDKK